MRDVLGQPGAIAFELLFLILIELGSKETLLNSLMVRKGKVGRPVAVVAFPSGLRSFAFRNEAGLAGLNVRIK